MRKKTSVILLQPGHSRWLDSQYFLVAFQNAGNLLEVQAVKAMAGGIPEFNAVVFQAPIVALQGDDFVDLLQKVGDGRVGVELHGEYHADLGKRMASHYQAQAKSVVISHLVLSGSAASPRAESRVRVDGRMLPADGCRRSRSMEPGNGVSSRFWDGWALDAWELFGSSAGSRLSINDAIHPRSPEADPLAVSGGPGSSRTTLTPVDLITGVD